MKISVPRVDIYLTQSELNVEKFRLFWKSKKKLTISKL